MAKVQPEEAPMRGQGTVGMAHSSRTLTRGAHDSTVSLCIVLTSAGTTAAGVLVIAGATPPSAFDLDKLNKQMIQPDKGDDEN